MSQAYHQSQPVWLWLGPDPEEPQTWIIVNMAATAAHDVPWFDNETELEEELRDVLADEPGGIPDNAAGALVCGCLWSERIDSIDYGTDYDGGIKVSEVIWLYGPSGMEEPLDHE